MVLKKAVNRNLWLYHLIVMRVQLAVSLTYLQAACGAYNHFTCIRTQLCHAHGYGLTIKMSAAQLAVARQVDNGRRLYRLRSRLRMRRTRAVEGILGIRGQVDAFCLGGAEANTATLGAGDTPGINGYIARIYTSSLWSAGTKHGPSSNRLLRQSSARCMTLATDRFRPRFDCPAAR